MNIDTQAHFCTRHEDGEETPPSGIGNRSEMTRKGWLAGMIAVGFAMAPGLGRAQQGERCPVERLVRETREHNAASDQALDEKFYQKLADNYRSQCARAEKTIVEMEGRLKEFEAGKRSDKDGYVILQTLANKYDLLRAGESERAVEIKRKLAALVKKHPDFPNTRDFRLTEEVDRSKRVVAEQREATEKAKRWKPRDEKPLAFYGAGKDLVARFQSRLEFFTLDSASDFALGEGQKVSLTRSNPDGSKSEIMLSSLTPRKTLSFRRRLDVLPRTAEGYEGRYLLVCTYAHELGTSFAPVTREDQDLAQKAGEHMRPWINESGLIDDFCGIVDYHGAVIYKFPVVQKNPGTLLQPLAVVDERAAVAVGERITSRTDDLEYPAPGNFREVLIWSAPASLKRIPIQPKEKFWTPLMSRFLKGELK